MALSQHPGQYWGSYSMDLQPISFISGKFSKFDYGKEKNQIFYNSTEPPLYDLSRISIPIATFNASNDLFVDEIDFHRLVSQLPNVVHQYLVPYHDFNHIDFVYAIDAPTLVYSEIFRLLDHLSKETNYFHNDFDDKFYSIEVVV